MKIIINHQPVDVKEGITVMEACRTVGIDIPSLCFLKDVSENASCGVCVVEVKGARSLLRSCITKVTDGMEILTASPRVREARKVNVELILANHPVLINQVGIKVCLLSRNHSYKDKHILKINIFLWFVIRKVYFMVDNIYDITNADHES